MADRAQVTSVEAIESFRSKLIIYLTKAKPTLEEVSNEVMRTKVWLQNDQRSYWENQMRLRKREMERAQAELFSARLSKLQQATGVQEMAFHRAQQAVREAEEKMALLKKWTRELENRSDPLVRLVDQLHGYLTTDMYRAVAYLAQVVQTLEAYADVTAPGVAPPVVALEDPTSNNQHPENNQAPTTNTDSEKAV